VRVCYNVTFPSEAELAAIAAGMAGEDVIAIEVDEPELVEQA
jgi:hypothetical protein